MDKELEKNKIILNLKGDLASSCLKNMVDYTKAISWAKKEMETWQQILKSDEKEEFKEFKQNTKWTELKKKAFVHIDNLAKFIEKNEKLLEKSKNILKKHYSKET